MRADTQSITINAEVGKVFEFVRKPENLAKWAGGYCKSIEKEDDEWLVETMMGEVKLRCECNEEFGVVDYYLTPALPMRIAVHSRVVANGQGAEFIFTQFQLPFLPAGIFEDQIETAKEGLLAMKQLLEAQCGQ